MFSIGFRMNCEDRLEVQGSTPLGARHCERWFSIKVRPLWGPWSGEWSIVTVAMVIIDNHDHRLIPPNYDASFKFKDGTADVIYHCQKRKINENLQISEAKGEFVE